ncbi:MAG: thioredoxin-disulfide reductase, partial [Anaerolineae bacterium]
MKLLSDFLVKQVMGNGYCNSVVVNSPDGQEIELGADGTFVEKALLPNSGMVADLVELDENGFIREDC